MTEQILPSLGLAGTLIFVSAYLPQIIHLVKVKDSTGISIMSWSIWLFGALLLFVYAVSIGDIVFLSLTILEIIALATVILLALKYKNKKN